MLVNYAYVKYDDDDDEDDLKQLLTINLFFNRHDYDDNYDNDDVDDVKQLYIEDKPFISSP